MLRNDDTSFEACDATLLGQVERRECAFLTKELSYYFA